VRIVRDDSPPWPVFAIQTSRSGSRNGSGRSRSGLMTLNTVVAAATPIAMISTAKAVNPGSRRIRRRA